jgi:hypothetical protein
MTRLRTFTGHVEMEERVLGAQAKAVASLADPQVFAQVGIGLGTVMWADEMDLAPDVMYETIKRDGVRVLR